MLHFLWGYIGTTVLVYICCGITGSLLRVMVLELRTGSETRQWLLTFSWSSGLRIRDLDLFCILNFLLWLRTGSGPETRQWLLTFSWSSGIHDLDLFCILNFLLWLCSFRNSYFFSHLSSSQEYHDLKNISRTFCRSSLLDCVFNILTAFVSVSYSEVSQLRFYYFEIINFNSQHESSKLSFVWGKWGQ